MIVAPRCMQIIKVMKSVRGNWTIAVMIRSSLLVFILSPHAASTCIVRSLWNEDKLVTTASFMCALAPLKLIPLSLNLYFCMRRGIFLFESYSNDNWRICDFTWLTSLFFCEECSKTNKNMMEPVWRFFMIAKFYLVIPLSIHIILLNKKNHPD
jgi:hypothetical protein